MDLSIVTTLYCSEATVREFYRRAVEVSERHSQAFEIIFVNDGSPDNSLDIVQEIQKKDPRVVVVDLSRNFGHHKAIMTGLSIARGERIFLIDSDLEEEPEWLTMFFQHLNDKCDVVYGVQETRRGSFMDQIAGHLFYSLLKYVMGGDFPRNFVTARLMTRRYVESLLRFKEQEIFLGGLWYLTGYRQVALPVKKHQLSPTTYSLTKKLALFVNAVTSFSNRPLILIFYTGVVIFALGMAGALIIIIQQLFFNVSLVGWPSLMVSIWTIGGLSILFNGIIGIYVSKIFSETKGRPYTIVKDVFGRTLEHRDSDERSS